MIVAKLWREFVSPDPDEADVRRIAADFRRAGYRIPVALSKLLNSDAFWSQDNRGVLVKSPVELVVGTLRSLEVAPDDATPFALAAAGMGQNLFSPPNVKGWRGGDAWIDSSTLLARKQFVESISRYEESRTMRAMTATPALPASRALLTPQPQVGRCRRGCAAAALRIARRSTARVPRPFVLGHASWRRCRATRLAAKRRNGGRCCCRSRPAGSGRRPPGRDALAFVRLTPCSDPVYQLKCHATRHPQGQCGRVGLRRARQRASVAFAAAPDGASYRNLLVLIELKGGNDGLNTLVPIDDPGYAPAPEGRVARDSARCA